MPNHLLASLYPKGLVYVARNNPKKDRRRALFEVVGHTGTGIKLVGRRYQPYGLSTSGIGLRHKRPTIQRAYRFANGTLIRLPGAILIPFKPLSHQRPYEHILEQWKRIQVLRKRLYYMHFGLGCDTPILEALHFTWS